MNMRKIQIALLGCLLLASCKVDVDSIVPYFSKIQDDGFGSQISFDVYASGTWSCATVSEIKGLTVTPSTGNGQTMVTVTIPENNTGAGLLSYLNFTCGSAKTPVAVFHEIPSMNLGNRSYPARKLADGNWWTCTNMGSIAAGKNVSAANFSTNTGIWYPCKPDTGEADNTKAGIEAKGYLYSPAELAGLCPEGWHLPTTDEWETLLAKSGYDALKEAGFNLAAIGYVTEGTAYAGLGQITKYACRVDDASSTQNAMILTEKESGTVLSMGFYGSKDGVSVRCVKDTPVE